jgi:hypothetical protein
MESEHESEDERDSGASHETARSQPRSNEGLVKLLLACPEKGFFVPIESESTDTLSTELF